MTNDEWVAMQLDDLLEIIRKLELRIIALEQKQGRNSVIPSDAYYWEHG